MLLKFPVTPSEGLCLINYAPVLGGRLVLSRAWLALDDLLKLGTCGLDAEFLPECLKLNSMSLSEGIDAQLQSIIGLCHSLDIALFVNECIKVISLPVAVFLKFSDAIKELERSYNVWVVRLTRLDATEDAERERRCLRSN